MTLPGILVQLCAIGKRILVLLLICYGASVFSAFEGVMPARYLRHGSQPEDYAVIRDMPQLEPYWAAGFSFSRGHFKLRVPYDAYLPMVFQVSQLKEF